MKKLRKIILLVAMGLVGVILCMDYLSDLIEDLEIKEANAEREYPGTSVDGGVTVESPDSN